MDKIRLARGISLIVLAALTIPTIVYYNTTEYKTENQNLKRQVEALQEELNAFRTANLTSAFGVIEEPPISPEENPQQYCLLSHLWITGWVYNSGGSIARNVGVNVLAFDDANNVLMNVTVPVKFYADTATDDALERQVPRWTHFVPLSEIEQGSLLSMENATVRFGVFHEGSFPDSTRYEVTPVWENEG